jgi:hypothetical protein
MLWERRTRRKPTPLRGVAPIRRTLTIAALCAICGGPLSATAAHQAVLELDHVYVVVPAGAVAALQALRQAGLVIDSSVSRHTGQGTASVAAFFENAYLELLWVDSAVAVDSLHRQDWADFTRAQAWRQSGASPFGVGLHFLSGTASDLKIPMRRDAAGWLRPGTYYVLLRQPAESLAADLFIVPGYSAITAWVERHRSRRPDLFAHPLGVRRVTRAVVRGPGPHRPRAAALGPRLISFEDASSPHLVLEFDGGQHHQTLDLRSVLPLVILY